MTSLSLPQSPLEAIEWPTGYEPPVQPPVQPPQSPAAGAHAQRPREAVVAQQLHYRRSAVSRMLFQRVSAGSAPTK